MRFFVVQLLLFLTFATNNSVALSQVSESPINGFILFDRGIKRKNLVNGDRINVSRLNFPLIKAFTDNKKLSKVEFLAEWPDKILTQIEFEDPYTYAGLIPSIFRKHNYTNTRRIPFKLTATPYTIINGLEVPLTSRSISIFITQRENNLPLAKIIKFFAVTPDNSIAIPQKNIPTFKLPTTGALLIEASTTRSASSRVEFTAKVLGKNIVLKQTENKAPFQYAGFGLGEVLNNELLTSPEGVNVKLSATPYNRPYFGGRKGKTKSITFTVIP
jgi:hypothetical protein